MFNSSSRELHNIKFKNTSVAKNTSLVWIAGNHQTDSDFLGIAHLGNKMLSEVAQTEHFQWVWISLLKDQTPLQLVILVVFFC